MQDDSLQGTGPLETALRDATAIASAVRTGDASAEDVLAESRSRADSAPSLCAFIQEDWDGAAIAAKEVDRRRARGEDPGPLAGVPLSVKDVIAVAGLRLTGGSAAYAGNVASFTAIAVRRLQEAGAVMIGKTNCPEFAFGAITESAVGGRTLNPRFPGATAGGSSGGEAAAVAAGISALGLGTDYGGSLRWPAQCVGITALRPTPRTVPDLGIVPGAGGWYGVGNPSPPGARLQAATQVMGPLARSVRDLRTALAVLTGLRPGVGTLGGGALPGNVAVAWSDGSALGPVRREVSAMMASLAQQIGPEVRALTHVPDLFAGSLAAYNRLRPIDPMIDHAAAVAGRERLVLPANLDVIRRSMETDARELDAAFAESEQARRRDLAVFDTADIVLLPVAGGPACDVSGKLDIDGQSIFGWDIMGQCRAVTMVGAPVVSLPVALSSEGLPLSVQVVARPGADALALDFAEWLEGSL
ncbi:amidase family protein [Pseudarthrobacter siccitolerans]|uniref:Amidase family protein n=1 Tax=Pseudarthrobacter siccitolerans TaxID=861266 RepID=A0A024H576_9MICC|nr:amidase [Pseudarthrobacter siccitolerans]CCQ47158.1 amidase family protein [Pseudarthrobacter siccitolerans]